MKLNPRTAGALAAIGGMLFLLLTYGVSRMDHLITRFVDIEVPSTLLDCCACTGIGLFALPLALLAMTLFRDRPDGDGPPPG